jgi:hypothetical protein
MLMSFFEAGGFAMYPTAFFGLLLVAACALYAARTEPKQARVALLLGAITLLSGLLGWARAMIWTCRFVSTKPAGEQFSTLLVGCGESLHNLVLALTILVLAGLVACIGLLRGAGTSAAPTGK